MQDDPEEVAARQRLSRLNTRPSTSGRHPPVPTASPPQPSSASASSSGRHVVPPKLGSDDGWAAELDGDDSWEGLEQKSAAGKQMLSHLPC